MTYHSDPKRWTESTGEVPELLRGAFEAGSREGPSDFQMRTLALKLAAVGGGAAVAAGAATAHASATAGGGMLAAAPLAGTGGALTLTKIAVSLALVGAAATGTVFWQRSSTTPAAQPAVSASVQAHTTSHEVPSEVAATQRAAIQPAGNQQPSAAVTGSHEATAPGTLPQARAAAGATVAAADVPALPRTGEARELAAHAAVEAMAPAAVGEAAASEAAPSSTRSNRSAARAERHARREAAASRETNNDQTTYTQPSEIVNRSGESKRSEIELLRTARSALAAQPREAYRLTEQHRTQYPQGVFTQERDALAVEALLRAGDLKHARQLAEGFVKRYPSSPHAHRFREAMNLQ